MKPISAAHSIIIRLRHSDTPDFLGRIASAIGEAEGSIGVVDVVNVEQGDIIRDITVDARDVEHGKHIARQLEAIPGVSISRVSDRTFLLHQGGKIEVCGKNPIRNREDLSMVYTPGVARVCRAVQDDPERAFDLTIRGNTVAVVSDGSAVLGLGNIGPEAAMPVMEGKCQLFKDFGGVNAFPICLDTQDVDQIVDTCTYLAPTFGPIRKGHRCRG